MRKFIEQAQIVHKGKYDYSKVRYKNNSTKVVIICPKHGEFEQIPKDHLRGFGCKKCGYLKLSSLNSSSAKDFIKKAKLKHGDKYNYDKADYVNSKTHVVITCPIHGDFKQIPANHLRGAGCFFCCFEHTTDEFIRKARLIHKNKYNYGYVKYVNHKTPIKIICPDHGEFLQRPSDHLAGCGCPICSIEATRNKLLKPYKSFVEDARRIHKDKYSYVESSYSKAIENMSIICPDHGVFQQSPNNHLKGNGCPICSLNKRRLKPKDIIKRANCIHDSRYEYLLKHYKNLKSLIKVKCKNHGWFEQSVSDHLQGHGCPQCFHPVSKGEKELLNFIKSIYDSKIIENSRKTITPYELDIYLPDCKLAVEYDGVHWHSYNRNETKEEKFKHYNKHELCLKKGIRLVQIWENEWIHRQHIVKSLLVSRLRRNNRIFARNCKIVELTNREFNKFINNNHLQGYISTKYRYGLTYDNNLVMAMGFNKHCKYDYEITRLASKIGVSVVGGASKIFQHHIRLTKPQTVLSFANARYSVGEVYKKLGFKLIGRTNPGYFYTIKTEVFNRVSYQKHKLSKKLKYYDPSKTEAENMFDNGFRRLWDAGNYKFLWKVSLV